MNMLMPLLDTGAALLQHINFVHLSVLLLFGGLTALLVPLVVVAGMPADAPQPGGPAISFRGHGRPAAPAPVQPAETAAAVPARQGPARILVVDDSAVVRARLTRLLKPEGYTVDVAEDGVEALERLSSAFYDVMITDLEMPNMNGAELIANVQGARETEDLPIIAITGHDEFLAKVRDFQGLYGIYKKPWHDRELLQRVTTVSKLRPRPVTGRFALARSLA